MRFFLAALRLIATAIPLLTTALPSAATQISVSADVGWSCGTGTGGFEAGCITERGRLEFTYEDSVLDTNPDPNAGTFEGAIVSFRMLVNQELRPDLRFALVPGPSRITTTALGAGDLYATFSWLGTEASGLFPASSFSFSVYNVSNLSHEGGSLSAVPSLAFWQGATAYGASVAPLNGTATVGETDWGQSFVASAAPEASSLAMAALGLLIVGAATPAGRRRTAPSR